MFEYRRHGIASRAGILLRDIEREVTSILATDESKLKCVLHALEGCLESLHECQPPGSGDPPNCPPGWIDHGTWCERPRGGT